MYMYVRKRKDFRDYLLAQNACVYISEYMYIYIYIYIYVYVRKKEK